MRNLFETFIDVGSGLFLSTLIQLYIFPFLIYIQQYWRAFI